MIEKFQEERRESKRTTVLDENTILHQKANQVKLIQSNLVSAKNLIFNLLAKEQQEHLFFDSEDVKMLLIDSVKNESISDILSQQYKREFEQYDGELEKEHINTLQVSYQDCVNYNHNFYTLFSQSDLLNSKKYQAYYSSYGLDLRLGNKYYLLFLRMLDNSSPQVRLNFRHIITYKWLQVKPYLFYQLFLYSCLNAFYTASILSEYELEFTILALIFLVILVVLELKCSLFDPWQHFTEVYNLLDFIVFIMLTVSMILNLSYEEYN